MVCSFCGKNHDINTKLIANSDGSSYICLSCASACLTILKEAEPKQVNFKCPNPDEIKKHLDDYIIGQVEAKKILSVAVYNHFKRINYNKKSKKDDVVLGKSNVLLVGPTGSGKTYLSNTLAKILNVPFASCDATTFTEAGYVGEDVESVLIKLIQNAKGDVSLAEKGIVYIDEIDKIAKRAESKFMPKDPSGEGVQQALLKLMEGTVVSLNTQGKKQHNFSSNTINTDNILFICGGAFVGLDKIIENRECSSKIGFNNALQNKMESKIINPIDLVTFGLIPEFVGRLPVVASLHELSEQDLIKIMTKPKNALVKQYKQLFLLDDVNLEIDKSALSVIAKSALKLKSGARALRSILENTLLDDMYIAPTNKKLKKIVIKKKDEDHVISQKFLQQSSKSASV